MISYFQEKTVLKILELIIIKIFHDNSRLNIYYNYLKILWINKIRVILWQEKSFLNSLSFIISLRISILLL